VKQVIYILAALLVGCLAPGTEAQGPPNVLFIAIDDLNDWVGQLGGHPQARTPHMDGLMRQGVVFTNAHCAAPVCASSRSALMSGLRPSTTGWYTNQSRASNAREVLDEHGVSLLPEHFRGHGYKTFAAGKLFHMGVYENNEQGLPGWDEARTPARWPAYLAERGKGYGGPKGDHFYPFPEDSGTPFAKTGRLDSLCWGALEDEDIHPDGMPDEQIAAWAVDRLQQDHGRPFFMAIGFVRPHVPYTAPKAYFDRFPLDEIEVPAVPEDEFSDIPTIGKVFAYGMGSPRGDHQAVRDLKPGYDRELVRAYLACTTFVDAQVGKVLEALENSEHADNTIVVLWTDHGQHLGEKRHWRKNTLWEEATRVVLAIRVPGETETGRVCARSVSLLDMYPTLNELCGLPNPGALEGVSLGPLLEDVDAAWDTPAVTTWFRGNHSVRSEHWRYTRYRDGAEELYDHRVDPGEHRNLATDPNHAATIRELRKHLPAHDAPAVLLETMKEDRLETDIRRFEASGFPDWLTHYSDTPLSPGRLWYITRTHRHP